MILWPLTHLLHLIWIWNYAWVTDFTCQQISCSIWAFVTCAGFSSHGLVSKDESQVHLTRSNSRCLSDSPLKGSPNKYPKHDSMVKYENLFNSLTGAMPESSFKYEYYSKQMRCNIRVVGQMISKYMAPMMCYSNNQRYTLLSSSHT